MNKPNLTKVECSTCRHSVSDVNDNSEVIITCHKDPHLAFDAAGVPQVVYPLVFHLRPTKRIEIDSGPCSHHDPKETSVVAPTLPFTLTTTEMVLVYPLEGDTYQLGPGDVITKDLVNNPDILSVKYIVVSDALEVNMIELALCGSPI